MADFFMLDGSNGEGDRSGAETSAFLQSSDDETSTDGKYGEEGVVRMGRRESDRMGRRESDKMGRRESDKMGRRKSDRMGRRESDRMGRRKSDRMVIIGLERRVSDRAGEEFLYFTLLSMPTDSSYRDDSTLNNIHIISSSVPVNMLATRRRTREDIVSTPHHTTAPSPQPPHHSPHLSPLTIAPSP